MRSRPLRRSGPRAAPGRHAGARSCIGRDTRRGLWEDFHDRSPLRFEPAYDHAMRLRKTGASVEEEMPSGTPDEALAKVASRPGTRLLVVGSLGRRSREWLLGSAAERVADARPCADAGRPFRSAVRGVGARRAAVEGLCRLRLHGHGGGRVGLGQVPCSSGSVRGCCGLRRLAAERGRAPRDHRAVPAESQPPAGAANPRARAIGKGERLVGRGRRPHSRRTEHRSCRLAAGRDGARGAVGPRCRRYPPAARLGPRRASVNFARLAAQCADERRLHSRAHAWRQSSARARHSAGYSPRATSPNTAAVRFLMHTARYLPVASCGCSTFSSRRA